MGEIRHAPKRHAEKEKEYINKTKTNGAIGAINGKWETGKLNDKHKNYKKETDNNDTKPLWSYRKTSGGQENNSKHTPKYQQGDKTETHDEKQTLEKMGRMDNTAI